MRHFVACLLLLGCDAPSALLHTLAPATLPPALADSSNRFADDPAAAALGQRFFFDPGFSGVLLDGDEDGGPHALGVFMEARKVACAGCHVPKDGFSDTRTLGGQLSLGAAWGKRRAPSLLDLGQAKLLMWDGRHDALYNQPFGPIEGFFEMNSSRLFTAREIYSRYRAEYEAIFGAMPDLSQLPALPPEKAGCEFSPLVPPPICHGVPGDHAEYDGLSDDVKTAVTQIVVNFGKVLGAYERRLTCGASRFDAWVHGKSDAMNESEQRGAELFVGRAGCVSCHSGPYLSDQKFHNVGLRPIMVSGVFVDAGDEGASAGIAAAKADPLNVGGAFSDGDDQRLSADAAPGSFRTPILRCVAGRPSFLHTAQMRSLAEVVAFFNRGGDTYGFPGTSELHPLGLSAQDEADLVAFLRALDGPGPDPSLQHAP